jgi:hypothetical protein
MFVQFVDAARLQIDPASIVSRGPPKPDIEFILSGSRGFAELVEVTDPYLARRHSMSLKQHKITGGCFSQVVPLVYAFRSKSQKTYATDGAPLMLLAYYDKQYPADSVDPDLIPREVGGVAADMVASGVWAMTWVYDSWRKRVLWVYPEPVREVWLAPPNTRMEPTRG